MIFGRKKETMVKELIAEHLKKTDECLKSMQQTMDKYLQGQIEEAKKFAYNTHLIESEADKKRREIIEILYQGAFLPIYREGLLNFISLEDKIADSAESCCDFALCQRSEVPGEYKERLLEIVKKSTACFEPFKKAVLNLFENFQVVREKVAEVNKLEEIVDTNEWKVTHDLFMSKLSLAEKIHLRDFIWHIARISDIIEDAADNLEILVVQKRF